MRQTINLALPSAVTPAACIAVSSRGLVLPDGSGGVAVELDNRSGFWLQIYPSGSFVPPYTVGAVVAFGVETPSVDVLYVVNGPAGQISTLGANDTVTATLYDRDEAPPASEGVAFIVGFTGTRTAVATVGNVTPVVLIAAVAGKRIRIWSILYKQAGGTAIQDGPMSCATLDNPVTSTFDAGYIQPGRWSDFHAFPSGLDFPVGAGVQCQATGVYTQASLNVIATYQII